MICMGKTMQRSVADLVDRIINHILQEVRYQLIMIQDNESSMFLPSPVEEV